MSKIYEDVSEPVAIKALKDLLRFFKSSLQFLIIWGFFFLFSSSFELKLNFHLWRSIKWLKNFLVALKRFFFFISGYFLELFWKCNFLFDPWPITGRTKGWRHILLCKQCGEVVCDVALVKILLPSLRGLMGLLKEANLECILRTKD